VVTVAAWSLRAFCFLAINGFSPVGAVLAFYVLSIQQMCGKVSNYHHMLWLISTKSQNKQPHVEAQVWFVQKAAFSPAERT
jgi:hypothetical protein